MRLQYVLNGKFGNPPTIGRTARISYDPLVGDRIDCDAWLLPPKQLEPAGRVARFISVLAGSVFFVIELACIVAWIV